MGGYIYCFPGYYTTSKISYDKREHNLDLFVGE